MRDFPFKTSFWFTPEIETSPALQGTQYADVAVIGGGYAGLSSARHLKETDSSLRVALVDAQHIGYGASGRNAGWLMGTPPIYWLLDNFQDRQRVDDIRFTTQLSLRNIRELGQFVAREGIACDWTPTQNQLVARNAIEAATIRWTAERFTAIGLENALDGRVLFHELVTLQPYQLARGLRDYLLRLGVIIYENSPVARVEPMAQGMLVTTTDGAQLIAEKVILATNAYTKFIDVAHGEDLPSPEHTYILVTEPLDDALVDRISAERKPFVDPSLAYYIGRILPDKRLLLNGIDRKSQNTLADDQHQPSYEHLYDVMLRRYPFLRDVPLAAAWGGAYQGTASDAPIVRAAKDNLILNVGYGGGSGIGPALLSGRLTTDLVLGAQSQDVDAQRLRKLYDASRFPPLGFARAAVGVVKSLIMG